MHKKWPHLAFFRGLGQFLCTAMTLRPPRKALNVFMFTLFFLLYLRGGGGGGCTPGVRVWVRSLYFTQQKYAIFSTLFLTWTTVLKKRNEKRLTQLQTLYQRKRKKNIQYFWPKRLKTIPILTISSQKPYYLGFVYTKNRRNHAESVWERTNYARSVESINDNLLVTYHDHQFPGCRLVVFAVFAFLCAICCSSSVFSFCSLLVQLFVSFSYSVIFFRFL